MKIRLLGGVAALLLAVIGTSILLIYVQGADSRAQAGMEPTKVLVVQERVPAGTAAEELAERVTTESLPAAAVASGAVTDLTKLSGKVSAADLLPGEQLRVARFVAPADLQAPGTVDTPEGMQTLTLKLEPQRVLGGTIRAGDTVGVFVSFDKGADESDPEQPTTKLLFQKVLVTAVQGGSGPTGSATDAENQTSDDSPGPMSGQAQQAAGDGSVLVTLARNDADAAKVVFGAEFGTIWLSHQPEGATESAQEIITKMEAYQ